MQPLKFLIFLTLLVSSCTASGQFDKANDYFTKKEYAKAIPLYEQGLKEKESTLAKTRLAQCYQILNRLVQAESLLTDVVKDPKAKPVTYKLYGEVLMGNGKYAQAKTWFERYFEVTEGKDSSALHLAAACDLVGTIKPYYVGAQTAPATFNSESDDHLATFAPDGALVFTSDRSQDLALLKKKSGATGRDYLKLWSIRYGTAGWLEPEHYSNKVNDINVNTAGISFDTAGTRLVFSRNNTVTSKKGEYKMHLFVAEMNEKGKVGKAEKLDFSNDEINYMHPTLSANGDMVVFSCDSKGEGGMDLFVSYKRKEKWSVPRNLGAVVNTPRHEAFAYLAPDGRLFFASKGHQGFGGFDLFVSQYDSTAQAWTPPVNLGLPINSPSDDIAFTLAPKQPKGTIAGTFSSTRGSGNDDIYFFWQGAEAPAWAQARVTESVVNEIVTPTTAPATRDTATLSIDGKSGDSMATPAATQAAQQLDASAQTVALLQALNSSDNTLLAPALLGMATVLRGCSGCLLEVQTRSDAQSAAVQEAVQKMAEKQQVTVRRGVGDAAGVVLKQ